MKRKYQIFISSTYKDLKDERQAAVEAVLLAGHIPAGMELFSAGDESQLDVIRRWIDDSDIFMLVLGARYGSIEPKSGKSYVEIEYDHAVARGKPYFALVLTDEAVKRKEDGKEAGPESASGEALQEFRAKILRKISRSVEDSKDIKLFAMEAIRHIEEKHSLTGWVRGDEAIDVQPLVDQIANLTNENVSLKRDLSDAKTATALPADEIADFDSRIEIRGTYIGPAYGDNRNRTIAVTWRELFSLIAPILLEHPGNEAVRHYLTTQLFASIGMTNNRSQGIHEQDFQTIKIQFSALGLVRVKYSKTTNGGMALFWSLTEKGEKALYENRTVKRN